MKKFVVRFYAALFAVSLFWMWIRGDDRFFVHPEWPDPVDAETLWRGLALGVCTAVAVVVFSRLASRYFEWARRIEREFAKLLGPLRPREIVVVSVMSGICEEAFFRGALQPTLGWSLTTLLFGLMHIGPSLKFLPWTFSALVLGGILGWYYEVNGTLLAPVIAHFLINLVNLTFIRRKS